MSRYVSKNTDRSQINLIPLKQLKEQIDKTGEISLTDQEARLMSSNNMGYDVAYNMQTAVSVDVTNNTADQGQLYPMVKQAKQELEVNKKRQLIVEHSFRTIKRTRTFY